MSERRPEANPVPRWIAAAILLHLAAWAGWLVLAGRHPVAQVPLARAEAAPPPGKAGP